MFALSLFVAFHSCKSMFVYPCLVSFAVKTKWMSAHIFFCTKIILWRFKYSNPPLFLICFTKTHKTNIKLVFPLMHNVRKMNVHLILRPSQFGRNWRLHLYYDCWHESRATIEVMNHPKSSAGAIFLFPMAESYVFLKKLRKFSEQYFSTMDMWSSLCMSFVFALYVRYVVPEYVCVIMYYCISNISVWLENICWSYMTTLQTQFWLKAYPPLYINVQGVLNCR